MAGGAAMASLAHPGQVASIVKAQAGERQYWAKTTQNEPQRSQEPRRRQQLEGRGTRPRRAKEAPLTVRHRRHYSPEPYEQGRSTGGVNKIMDKYPFAGPRH